MTFWTQNYVYFSRGGDGTGQNQQFRPQKELNAKIQDELFLKSTSTHSHHQFPEPAHVLPNTFTN